MIISKYNNGGGSGSGMSPEQVQQQIDTSLAPYWESAETQNAINQAVSGLASEEYVQEALSGVNLENYYTSAQTEEAITSKNYVTSGQVKSQVEAYNYVTSGQVKSQVEAYDYATVSQLPVVPTSNTAFTNDEGYVNSAETKAQIEAYHYVNSGDVKSQVEAYGYITGVDLSDYWTADQTEAAIAQSVSGKADAKMLVDFDKTTQSERAALYTTLKSLNDGGSGATINKDYDFFKTVGAKQGLKIDYYTFSGGSAVFGKVVSPDNTSDPVIYGQVLTIDASGNVNVVTNTVGGVDLSAYYTSAQTEQAITSKNYVTSAQVETMIVDGGYMTSGDAQVISTALVDLNTRVSGLSAASADYLTSADTQDFITSAATAHMVVSSDDSIVNIVKIEQSDYDNLVAQSATSQTTLYVVVPDSI